MAHQVFVSYSHPDRECAYALVSRLEAGGVAAWIAPRDISPAAEWAAEIIDAISSARLMVLVFSSHSNDSPQVRREVERAVHRQVPVLPFRIEDVAPSKSLEYFLSSQHWMDAFPPPQEPHYQRLCAHLAGMLRLAQAAPGAAPTVAPAVTAAVVPAAPPLPDAAVKRLTRELALHVGPVAPHLVRRASAQAGDWEQLMQLLAAELDAATRQQFIDTCRKMRPHP